MAELTLVLGGAKSGKTALAMRLCQTRPGPWVYLATAQAWDNEMADRIRRHQAERGEGWITREEPLVPDEALARIGSDEASVVLLDCLNMWLSNLMAGQGLSADQVAARVERLIQTALACPARVVVVGNEVGQGIVPENRLAREFRDAAGTSHQLLARAAHDAWWVVAGLPVALKRDGRICADF